MANTIKFGYLIARKNKYLFDEILTFICNDGITYKVHAIGVRKENSKNKQNLLFGTLLEIDFYISKTINKYSKLKKVHTLQDINFNDNKSIKLLNKLLKKYDKSSIGDYEFYQNVINLLVDNKPLYFVNSFTYYYFLVFKLDKKINLWKCDCNSDNEKIGINLVTLNLVCKKCLNEKCVILKQEEIDCFYYLNNCFENLTENYLFDIKDSNFDNQNFKIIQKILQKFF